MSGIVGSKLNIRGSGLVGSLGTDGQHLLSAGPGKTNVFETAAGGGKLGQIIYTAFETRVTNSTDDFDIITSAGITPAATSSKILINIGLMLGTGSNSNGGFKLFRDSTAISVASTQTQSNSDTFWSADELFGGNVGEGIEWFPFSYLDSPSSTSELVYKVQTDDIYLMYYNRASAALTTGAAMSWITVTEILG